jgi:phosphoribosylformimino-5-aminoimidazole carboxamide ribonucleotide (ProFAR) isomerase
MIVIGSMDFYKGSVVRLTQGELDSVHEVKNDALAWLVHYKLMGYNNFIVWI